MYSITPSSLKLRDFFYLPKMKKMMLSSNCIPSIPLSTLSPRFRASKFSPASVFPVTRTIRVPETHRRFSTKKRKISCFRHEEFLSRTPNPESVEEVLHEELEKVEVDKPNVDKRNWVSNLGELCGGPGKHDQTRMTFYRCFNLRSTSSPLEKTTETIPKPIESPFVSMDIESKKGKIIGARFRLIGKPWTVPWTAETILQVTLLWTVSFWFVGSWMIPFGAHIIGFSKESLTYRGQALFSLLTDVTEGLAGILILHRCLSRFRPLPSDWFRFSLRGNWIFDVVLGCLMFPLVNRLSQFNLNLLPVLPSTPVTLSSVEQSIVARDPIAMALYALVLVVCAPLWEEIVFRGFLLPSLTKYMPVWGSILVSSIGFALAHFNVQRMLPLIFLGVVMGVTYARSRNLLPSILLHSLWNGFVFLDLMK